MRRHDAGQYNLACDEEVNAHYEESLSGLMYEIWLIRIYLRGFFGIQESIGQANLAKVFTVKDINR